MAVRRGSIAQVRAAAGARRPRLRAARPLAEGSILGLFGGVDGEPLSIIADASLRVVHQVQVDCDSALRVQRSFGVLADLRISSIHPVRQLADTSARILRPFAFKVDIALCIGVGVAFTADAELTVYRVILHEDHLILTLLRHFHSR